MDTYTLTETHTRPDGTITAVFQVTRATGSYEARIHAADLAAALHRLGVSMPDEAAPVESVPVAELEDLATLAASAG